MSEANPGQRDELDANESSAQRVQHLSQTYLDLADANNTAAAENRYLQARANFTDFELPESLDAAIQQLGLFTF